MQILCTAVTDEMNIISFEFGDGLATSATNHFVVGFLANSAAYYCGRVMGLFVKQFRPNFVCLFV